jgi:hypothetical protein
MSNTSESAGLSFCAGQTQALARIVPDQGGGVDLDSVAVRVKEEDLRETLRTLAIHERPHGVNLRPRFITSGRQELRERSVENTTAKIGTGKRIAPGHRCAGAFVVTP